jgi:hypothetical protein
MSDNFFDISTRQDNNLLNIICFDHINRLKLYGKFSDVKSLYKKINNVYSIFIYHYTDWIASKYSLNFETKKLNGYIEDIELSKIYTWNKKILMIFPEDSEEYYDIFPNKLDTFLIGSVSDKALNLKSLSEKLLKYPETFTVRNEVNGVIRKINRILKAIELKIDDVNSKFVFIEKSRSELLKYLFKNYNILLEKHSGNPDEMNAFFNFSFISEEYKLSSHKIFQNLSSDDLSKKENKLRLN